MNATLSNTTLRLCPRSVINTDGVEYALANFTNCLKLAVLAPLDNRALASFQGEASEFGDQSLLLCPLNTHNAAILRMQHDWLKPKLLGMHTSAGMGDRLGVATPGHVRAVSVLEGKVAPIFAQQSIREMKRTGRSPQQVMDDATWGIFEEGWQGGVGADADHLKTISEIDACLAAGFSFFTIDPGEYVDGGAAALNLKQLEVKANQLPADLLPTATGLLGKSFDIEGNHVVFDQLTLLKASVKYGKAIAHVFDMVEHLTSEAKDRPFEVEISMDETDKPTSPAEHIYIASELRRLGVRWVSFAPRFIGRFEKGVDYIGDVKSFASDLAVHAAIARQLGPYKLSLHSGSDKFSIYPAFMEKTQGLAHLKTAGTSYLEALRTIAELDQGLMEEIYIFAREHFETDKQSYLSSAQCSKAPSPEDITNWSELIDQFDAREILHVTYGSVLTAKDAEGKWKFFDRFMSTLQQNREFYFDHLQDHFRRHLTPFTSSNSWS